MTGNKPSELLPCPFCGGNSEVHAPIRQPAGDWRVGCCSCGIHKKAPKAEYAIAAWNTRAAPAQPSELVEKVAKAMMDHICRDGQDFEWSEKLMMWPEKTMSELAQAAIAAMTSHQPVPFDDRLPTSNPIDDSQTPVDDHQAPGANTTPKDARR
jgi:Lar family restriction alleviation protein